MQINLAGIFTKSHFCVASGPFNSMKALAEQRSTLSFDDGAC